MSTPFKVRRSGGPKSAIGKAKSSQNSLKHGITSSAAISVNEQLLVQSFIKEFEDFYNPQTPLEKLQIERIATCRAKLARLYEVESARLQMRINQLEHSTEAVFKELPHIDGVVKGMVQEMAIFGELTLPLDLTAAQLEAISHEVHDARLKGEVQNIWKFLPSLSRFLEGISSMKASLSLDERLELVFEYFEKIFSEGALYHEYLKKRFRLSDNLDPIKEDVVEEEDELDQHIRQSQARLRKLYGKGVKTEHKSDPPAVQSPAQTPFPLVLERCQVFAKLYQYYEQAQSACKQFLQTKSLLLQSTTLPANESDLLMRYQTTLERRLSSAIGELLALQRQR